VIELSLFIALDPWVLSLRRYSQFEHRLAISIRVFDDLANSGGTALP
jgi:hypothetical protein